MKSFPFLLVFILIGCAPTTYKPPSLIQGYTAEQLKTVSNEDICHDIAMHPTTDRIRNEKAKRKVDCSNVTIAAINSERATYQHRQNANTGPSFWQDMGKSLILMNAAMAQQQATQRTTCNSVSIPPIATAGCNSVCINGSWAEVC